MPKIVKLNGLFVVEVEQTEQGTFYRGLDSKIREENHLLQCEECQIELY